MFALTGPKAAKINLFSLLLGACLLLSSGAVAQEPPDSYVQDEQTFVEIKLTPEGVIAFDSVGNPWSWNFNSETFEPGRGRWIVARRGEHGLDAEPSELPVQLRAINQIFPDDNKKRVVVEDDEYVDGDITTAGSVTVRGWVKGNVRSYGRILVTKTGRIEGNARAPRVTVKTGGQVVGTIDEVDLFTQIPEAFSETVSTAGLWVLFGFAIFLTVAGALIIALMPQKLKRLTDCANDFPIRSFFLGLLFTFLMPMVMVLVAITVIGVVVIWAVPMIYLIAFFVGLVIVGRETGDKLLERITGRKATDILAYLTGLATLMILWLVVAILLGSNDEVSNGFGVFFLVIAILISTYPIMTGVGAAFLTRFGYRDYVKMKAGYGSTHHEAATPAPPPIPNGHPGFERRATDRSTPTSDQVPTPPPLHRPPTILPPGPDPENIRPDQSD